jgi:uncharacterized membrane protein YcaP (DUF421 family)
MHEAGILSVEQVQWGFIEPDGNLSFVRADDGDTGSVDDKSVG